MMATNSVRSSSDSGILCDSCQQSDIEDNDIPTATIYCIDCNENQCSKCSEFHGKLNASKDHKLVNIDINLRRKLHSMEFFEEADSKKLTGSSKVRSRSDARHPGTDVRRRRSLARRPRSEIRQDPAQFNHDYYQRKITQTEQQEHLEDPVHADLPSDVQERIKKEGVCGIENKNFEQKLEECRRENRNLAQELQASKKETAEKDEQYRILKENFDKALDREQNLQKELDAIKSRSNSDILENVRENLDSTSKISIPQQSHTSTSSENHKFHDCKDVTTIDKDFRRRLEETIKKFSGQKQEMLSRRLDIERLMKEYLAKSFQISKEVNKKIDTLKSLIDQHGQTLLGELSTIEQKHQTNMEREIDDIERNAKLLDSFVAFCSQMKVKGSAKVLCSCACNLIKTAEELSNENEEYLQSSSKLVEIKFIATDQDEAIQVGDNVIGKLSESSKFLFESKVFVFGIDDGVSVTKDIIEINLNRSNDVSKAQQMPFEMIRESEAAVHRDSIFVTGIGKKRDEIWRFKATSSKWKKCASLVQGRRRHSAAFVDHILYICGGWVDSANKTLDVEAYDTHKDQCATVGKLAIAVTGSGNCVPFKSSLYIFGGSDSNGEIVNKVQVYDTKLNTYTLLLKPMPTAQYLFPAALLRAALWENNVILLGCYGCFTYNFETEVWKVSHQIKTDAIHFGLIISDGLVFVIGGGRPISDSDGNKKWICRDDVRCVPVVNILNNEPIAWKHHSKLPTPSLAHSYSGIDFGLKE